MPTDPITITSPNNNATVSGIVTVHAVAGVDYVFSRVDFYVDGDSAFSDAAAPYRFPWDTAIYAGGSQHQLQAFAYSDTTYASNIVTVTVMVIIPNSLESVSTFILPAPGKRVATEGGHLFVAVGAEGMLAIDATIPAVPVEFFRFVADGDARGVDVDSQHAALAEADQGVQLFDVSDPDTVLALFRHDTPGLAWNVKIAGGHVYVADNDALVILAIVGDSLVSRSRFVISAGVVKDVDVFDTTAYVLDVNGVTVIDVSDPRSPQSVFRYDALRGLGISVFATENFVFAGTSVSLEMLAVAANRTLSEAATFNSQNGVTGVFVQNGAILTSHGGSEGGARLFISPTGDTLLLASEFVNGDNCQDIAAEGSYAFLVGLTKLEILRLVAQ